MTVSPYLTEPLTARHVEVLRAHLDSLYEERSHLGIAVVDSPQLAPRLARICDAIALLEDDLRTVEGRARQPGCAKRMGEIIGGVIAMIVSAIAVYLLMV